MTPFLFGLLIVGLGIGFMLFTYYLARQKPGSLQAQPPTSAPLTIPEMQPPNEAILMIETGGRVIYANQLAKEWFGYSEGQPNLERLAQRVRPGDAFLGLCFSEGQADFALDGRLIEGISYAVPLAGSDSPDGGNGSDSAMLVSMRRPKVTNLRTEGGRISQHALDIFAGLSQKMTASLDVDTTLHAILESVEQLIPSDLQEITIWDPVTQELVPYRFIGVPGEGRHLERTSDRYSLNHGYSGYIAAQREPLLVSDVDKFHKVRPAVNRKLYPFLSYMGMPMQVAEKLVGTLELASRKQDAFSDDDLEVLRILSASASVAISNAVRFQEEQKRNVELSGLAQLSQALNNQGALEELFNRLVNDIAELLAVKILGFLIYSESHQILEAQPPFRGIPTQLLNLYKVEIAPGSPAESILFQQERIITSDAVNDPSIHALGLDGMAIASGIHDTALVPLKTPHRILGFIQAADRLDGLPFDSENIRLLEIIANQAAAIIENAMLVKESQNRAQRAETLRRVASLAGSSATLDEILMHSSRELARLLRAEVAVILLLDENLGELRLHHSSLIALDMAPYHTLDRINMTEPRYQDTVTSSMEALVLKGVDPDQKVPDVYRLALEQAHIQSLMLVPFIVRGQGVGEILLGSLESDHFDQNDLTLVTTTASQLSNALEKSALYGQTDESLRRRVVQLVALNRISRELNTTLDLDRLLGVVYEQGVQTTDADCGAILLFESPENAKTSPRVSFQVGDTGIGSLTPVEIKVLRAGEPYIVRDYLKPDPHSPDTMPIPPHQGVRSSLIVPIAFQDNVVGLIHLHAQTPERFDTTSQEIAQSLAVQAAIAIGNAQRYQEQQRRNELLNRRVDTMTALLETTRNLSAGQPLEESLEAIAYGIQSATPFEVVLISMYDPQSETLHRLAGAGIPLEKLQELKTRRPPWSGIQELLQPQYLFSRSYFIPQGRHTVIPSELHIEQVYPVDSSNEDANELTWHSEDLLLVPLITSEGQPLGLISVDLPRNNLRPDRPAIESLEIFASQAALVIETYLRIYSLGIRSANLQSELEQIQHSLMRAEEAIPRLQENEQVQRQVLSSSSSRLQRLRASLDTADMVHQQRDRGEILYTLARQVLASMGMSAVMIAELADSAARMIHVVGEIPSGINPQALLGQRNPLRACLQSGDSFFVTRLDDQNEWVNSPLLVGLGAQAFICLPIHAALSEIEISTQGNKIDSALLAISQEPLGEFTPADQEIFTLLCRQVTISLQNSRLINETNRRLQEMDLLLEFSRQLGAFDPNAIIQALVDGVLRVIPAAQAGMAALWLPEKAVLQPQIAQGYSINEKILQIRYRFNESLPGQAFATGEVLSVDEVNFAKDYALTPEQLVLYRDATQGRFPISSLIVPLQTHEDRLGVLVLDNFIEPAAFSKEDQALVSVLARQTALTLENVHLYQAAEQRTVQLQTLTQVAGTITSSLQTKDLIYTLLDQVHQVVPFDTGTLWLRQDNLMTVRAASGFADSEERVGLSVALEDSRLLREMAQTNQPLVVKDVRLDDRFPALMEHPYLSWLGVPLLSKGDVIGVIVLEKEEEGFFVGNQIQAMVTFASQAAVALVNANLYEDSLRRTAELDDRSQRLALLNRLSTALSGSLDLERILGVLAREMCQALNASSVSVALLSESDEWVVRAQEPLGEIKLPLILPDCPVFAHLRQSLGVFITEDMTQEEDLLPLKDYISASGAQSLLIIPLISGNNLIGLSLIHSAARYRFSPDEVTLALTISNQIAAAIQNARLFNETERLFAETQQRSAELAALFDLGVRFTQVLDQNRLLEITFENVNRLIQTDAIVVALVESEDQMLAYVLDHGQRQEPIIVPRRGASFSEYVVSTNQPLLIEDTRSEVKPVAGIASGDPCRCWLGVPLVVRGITNGVLSIQSDQPMAFGNQQLHLLSQIANQLSVALDNAQLFRTVQNYTSELEQRVSERTEQVAREHRRIQTLLYITTELTASLDLDLVLNRTLGVLNETLESEHSAILLIQPDNPFLYLRASLGYTTYVPQSGQVSKVKRSEGLAGWVINNQQPALVDDLHEDSRWEQRADKTSLHRSAMAVPLMVGEDNLGVLMVYHRSPSMFNSDQLDLVQAVAKQIAIAINNTQLYGLIRDQAERLGDMLRTQHVETSRSQAILEAVADGVLVTDAHGKFTLFNASAEQILGLSRVNVLGESLEKFMGLFGKAAQAWMHRIRTWSEEPDSYEPGDSYEAVIELENRRVVSVHLAPVLLRNDFMGTVSIFRDITHQVEVDRLKSEFVATVSHELRTPMTSIKGYVDILLMGAAGQLTQQQTHFLDVVKANTERLAILVNDLLDVSRIEAGKATLSMQPVDLRSLIDEIVDAFSLRIKEEDRLLEFHKDIPSDLPIVFGDLERLRQIVTNIVENSCQYTPEGGEVWVSACVNGSFVQVDVRDTGIGVKPEETNRVFERFYRGEDPLVLATSGTGLGLAIVQTLIDMHHGRIWVESDGIPGRGSIFSFTLPIYDPDSPTGLMVSTSDLTMAEPDTQDTRSEENNQQEPVADDSDLIIGLDALEEIEKLSSANPTIPQVDEREEQDGEDWIMQ
jgi:PAS domain S-box-containing protein